MLSPYRSANPKSCPFKLPDDLHTINQSDNDGRTPSGFLPLVDTLSEKTPVVSVYDESTGELVYSMRFPGSLVRLPVYDNSRTYRVEISYGDAPVSEIRLAQSASPPGSGQILSFSAPHPSIVAGDATTLQWNVETFSTLTIDNGQGDVSSHTVNGIGHLRVSPSSTTTFTLTRNGSESASARISVFPTQATWLQQNFNAAQLADPQISGDSADPDGDGISNEDEYRFQTRPLDASSSPSLTSNIQQSGDGRAVTLEFASSFPLRSELATLRVESSFDLMDWVSLGSNSYRETSRVNAGSGTTRITIGLSDEIGDSRKKFYRASWTR